MTDAERRVAAIQNLKAQLDYMNDSPYWVYFPHLKEAVRDNINMLEALGRPDVSPSFRSYGPTNHGEYISS